MWTCNEIRQRSAAYFANELTAADNQRLEQHLAGCGKCRLELSEAYSGYRLASAAFNAPDADRGLNAARLGVIYAAASGGAAVSTTTARSNPARHGWFAAAAGAVIAAASWLGQPVHEAPAEYVAAALPAEPGTSEAAAPEVAEAPHVDYPPSYGLIYPADYRAAGGFTPDSQYATVMIDYDSVSDPSLFIYDPAYGLGRTVITEGPIAVAAPVPVEYGLGGPRGQVRL